MFISLAEESDKLKIRKLWEYCFDDPDYYNEYFFNKVFDPKRTMIAKNDNNVISCIQIRPYKIKFYNKILNTALLIGISTLPEYRGLGYSSQTLVHTLKWLKKNGFSFVTLTALYPSMYYNYGFKHISYLKKYCLPVDSFDKSKNKIKVAIQKVCIDDYNDLTNIYKEFHNKRYIYYIRDNHIFKQLHEEILVEKGNIYIIRNGNDPIGYFLSILEGKTLTIREFAYTNKIAIDSFFSFIYNHRGQINNVSLTTPKDEQFEELLNWNKKCLMTIRPYMLGRVLDINPFIDFFNSIESPFKIEDNIFKENSILIGKKSKIAMENIGIDHLGPTLFNYLNDNIVGHYNIRIPPITTAKSTVPFLNQYI